MIRSRKVDLGYHLGETWLRTFPCIDSNGNAVTLPDGTEVKWRVYDRNGVIAEIDCTLSDDGTEWVLEIETDDQSVFEAGTFSHIAEAFIPAGNSYVQMAGTIILRANAFADDVIPAPGGDNTFSLL
jgi:hypothetical protein